MNRYAIYLLLFTALYNLSKEVNSCEPLKFVDNCLNKVLLSKVSALFLSLELYFTNSLKEASGSMIPANNFPLKF